MFLRDGAATWTVKVARSQYLWEGLFYPIISFVRPAEWTPLPSLSDKTPIVGCCVPSRQNRMNCGGVIPLFDVRWGHHKPSSSLSMAFSDGNAHQRDSRRCLPHIWCSSYSSAGWETDGGPTAWVGAVWAMRGCETSEVLLIAVVNVTFTTVMWTREVLEIVEDKSAHKRARAGIMF